MLMPYDRGEVGSAKSFFHQITTLEDLKFAFHWQIGGPADKTYFEYHWRELTNQEEAVVRQRLRVFLPQWFNEIVLLLKNPSIRVAGKLDRRYAEELKDFLDLCADLKFKEPLRPFQLQRLIGYDADLLYCLVRALKVNLVSPLP